MSRISCNVHTCAHNVQNGCDLNHVSIGGMDAKKSGQTCCDSFTERTSSAQNAVCGCGCGENEIACKAEKCYYNEHGCCSALSVDVNGIGATEKNRTECETFVRK